MSLNSRFLSRTLRHEPRLTCLALGPGGWVPVYELLRGMKRAGRRLRADELHALVADHDKRRVIRSDDRRGGGRTAAPSVLWTAAVVAIRENHDIAAFYGRLRQAGKPFKVAVVAAMRTPIILANTMLRESRIRSPMPPRKP